MSKKIDFLILYEVKVREFESIVLLRNELAYRGYIVEYISFFERYDRKKIAHYKNNVKVAIMPSLYHTKEVIDIVYQVAGKVDYIVNLRWEQVFTNATEQNMDYYAYPKGAAIGAIHCCWGNRSRRLLEQAGVNCGHIAITGPIQMDFLRDMFDGYYLNKKDLFNKYNISTSIPAILFISSFSFSTMAEDDFKSYLDTLNDNEKSRFTKFVEVEKKSRYAIYSWLKKLSHELNCTVIYRPHPVEVDTEELNQLRNDNIRVIREENIKQWIKCSNQVYMWYSTSAAEAYVAQVPFSILRPVQILDEDDLPIYKDVEVIETYVDFVDSVKEKMAQKNYKMSLNTESMIDYYSITNVPSYIRTADFLEAVHKGKYNKFIWEGIAFTYYFKLEIKNIRRLVRNICYKLALVGVNHALMGKPIKDMLKKRIKKRDKFYANYLITDDEFESLQNKLWKFQYGFERFSNNSSMSGES